MAKTVWARLDELSHEVLALIVCVVSFVAFWTAVVYVPPFWEGTQLTGSSIWYTVGWLTSAGLAAAVGAFAYSRIKNQAPL